MRLISHSHFRWSISYNVNTRYQLITYLSLFSDYSKGFGGKFGVQNDRVDQSAVGWDHQEKLSQHESQKGPFSLSSFAVVCLCCVSNTLYSYLLCFVRFVHFYCVDFSAAWCVDIILPAYTPYFLSVSVLSVPRFTLSSCRDFHMNIPQKCLSPQTVEL